MSNGNGYYLMDSVILRLNYWEEPMRTKITLACTETGDKNYITTKNKRNNPERLELMKYSPRLKKRTLHRETK